MAVHVVWFIRVRSTLEDGSANRILYGTLKELIMIMYTGCPQPDTSA